MFPADAAPIAIQRPRSVAELAIICRLQAGLSGIFAAFARAGVNVVEFTSERVSESSPAKPFFRCLFQLAAEHFDFSALENLTGKDLVDFWWSFICNCRHRGRSQTPNFIFNRNILIKSLRDVRIAQNGCTYQSTFRKIDHRPWRRGYAGVHARRHAGQRQGTRPARTARDGHTNHPRQHLSSNIRPGLESSAPPAGCIAL